MWEKGTWYPVTLLQHHMFGVNEDLDVCLDLKVPWDTTTSVERLQRVTYWVWKATNGLISPFDVGYEKPRGER